MSERKNLKIDPDTYDALRKAKRKHETWDYFLNRILRERDSQAD